jgi:hypothetical protein
MKQLLVNLRALLQCQIPQQTKDDQGIWHHTSQTPADHVSVQLHALPEPDSKGFFALLLLVAIGLLLGCSHLFSNQKHNYRV